MAPPPRRRSPSRRKTSEQLWWWWWWLWRWRLWRRRRLRRWWRLRRRWRLQARRRQVRPLRPEARRAAADRAARLQEPAVPGQVLDAERQDPVAQADRVRRPEPAQARAGDQARALPRPDGLRREAMTWSSCSNSPWTTSVASARW